jgi:two-component system OmpR family sensor kinase
MRRLFRTLTGKLIIALMALIAALGCFYIVLTLIATKAHLEVVDQSLNHDVAEHVLDARLKAAIFDADADIKGDVFAPLMAVNPNAEIYLLDSGGTIVSHAAPSGKVKLRAVAIEPIKAFLGKSRELPIYGDDPRNPGKLKVFSAAEVRREGKTAGYVYVVLGGEAYGSAVGMFRESYVLRLSSGLLLGGIMIAVLLGAFSFYRLTGPLRQLMRTVVSFDPRNPTSAELGLTRISQADDEIGQLARSFGEMAARIAEQMRMLRNADEARREFMVHISHDLKTPIATTKGYLETLQMKWQTMQALQRDGYLSSALQSNERISAMVAGIFELSKLEWPEAPLQFEAFSVTELVQDICQTLQFEAGKTNVTLQADWDDPNVFLTGDIALIERALVNIIENAIKFSDPHGAVGIKIETRRRDVMISVTNRGRTIDKDELQKIFMPFYRGRHAGPETEGTGLGLTIAKRVAELHGGSIAVSSDPEHGTRFTIALAT